MNAVQETRQNIEKIQVPQKSLGYLFFKRFFDVVFSIIALVVLSPVYLIVAAAILIDDPRGGVFYCPVRVGKDGKKIKIYKFRSMVKDADKVKLQLSEKEYEEYRKNFKVENDGRITKVGKFIRKTSLDELPQFVNVLFGTLSIVGPRPVLDKETYLYGENRDVLLSVKPGITGLWQCSGRSEVTYESGERQALELEYVEKCSLIFDLKIMFKTVGAVLNMKGAR